jgi:hypothetical protein
MTFDLGCHKDQKATDALLDGVLKAYAADNVSLEQARYLLGHLIILAGKGDERLVRNWLTPLRLTDWLEKCRTARPYTRRTA